jgi:hypothetical protein
MSYIGQMKLRKHRAKVKAATRKLGKLQYDLLWERFSHVPAYGGAPADLDVTNERAAHLAREIWAARGELRKLVVEGLLLDPTADFGPSLRTN